jgi:hypothetical protein
MLIYWSLSCILVMAAVCSAAEGRLARVNGEVMKLLPSAITHCIIATVVAAAVAAACCAAGRQPHTDT